MGVEEGREALHQEAALVVGEILTLHGGLLLPPLLFARGSFHAGTPPPLSPLDSFCWTRCSLDDDSQN